ncbi:transposase [Sporomusaceae bacterium FL31]|nr:transposase [Sporomusaceae bacterium FL31]GCE35381.1 transposase [Sporomusaceae bacterium]
MAGKKGMKHYSEAIKQQAVRMHLEDGLTLNEVMIQLGITSKSQLKVWCRRHRNRDKPGVQPKPKGRPRKRPRSEQEQIKYELKQLRMENELLRNFLCEAGRS